MEELKALSVITIIVMFVVYVIVRVVLGSHGELVKMYSCRPVMLVWHIIGVIVASGLLYITFKGILQLE